MSAPQPLLERREFAEQAPRRGALHYLYCVSNRNGGRDTRKQVDVVRLDLLGHDQPFAFRANRIQRLLNRVRHLAGQYVASILWAPDHMVGRLVDAVAVGNDINHSPHGSKPGLLRKPAIPPPTEVGSFLAEIL